MSEKSVGSKGKPPDKQDVSDGGADVTKEKSGSNLNENASSRSTSTRIEKVESPKIYEKSKTLDKKIDIKPQMKINGVKNGVSKPSSRREDVGSGRFSSSANRSSSRGKTEFQSSALTVASTQSKQDTKKSGTNTSVLLFLKSNLYCLQVYHNCISPSPRSIKIDMAKTLYIFTNKTCTVFNLVI